MMIIVNARIYNVLLAGEEIHINAKILMSVFSQLISVQVWNKQILNGYRIRNTGESPVVTINSPRKNY